MKKRDTPLKTFREFIEIDDLQERTVRNGSILIAANRSRQSGDDAKKAFEAGINVLRRPVAEGDIEARLDQIRNVIGNLLIGMVHVRAQAGNHLAADVAGHLLREKP
jgi:hypothetical protein